MPSTRSIPRATYDDLQPLLKTIQIHKLSSYVTNTVDGEKVFQNWSGQPCLKRGDFLTPSIFELAWSKFD
jgi:hypothetical protein